VHDQDTPKPNKNATTMQKNMWRAQGSHVHTKRKTSSKSKKSLASQNLP